MSQFKTQPSLEETYIISRYKIISRKAALDIFNKNEERQSMHSSFDQFSGSK
jgi:hypothetical protein